MRKLFAFSLIFIFVILCFCNVQAQQTVGARNKYKIAKNMFYSGMYQDAEKELEGAKLQVLDEKGNVIIDTLYNSVRSFISP